ncbi:MAG: ThiF family adenylyltransferase [Planctomycetaceae bacterium]
MIPAITICNRPNSLLPEKTALNQSSGRVATPAAVFADAECAESELCGHTHQSETGPICKNDDCGAIDGSAIPEIDAALPRQTKARAWEGSLNAAARPNREDLPAPPERVHRRWDRLIRLVGNDGIRNLLNSHVTIFGLGGVGSYAAEALARSAVGRMTLVDFDDVCLTNVNRQLQAFLRPLASKAQLLAERGASNSSLEAWSIRCRRSMKPVL